MMLSTALGIMHTTSSALVLILSTSLSSAFLAASPRGVVGASRHGRLRSCASTTTTMTADLGGSSSGSRKAFVEGGAAALLASVAAVALPSPSLAKFDMAEVKGLDVNELEDTLTNDGAPPGLTGLVKGLIKNYRLDESLQQGAKYIEAQGDRNAAASAGKEALEFLAQTAEYFPAELDERTGAPKKLNAEALEFTINALGATRAKLDFFLSKVPSDALREARAEIKAEGGGES